MEQHLQWKREGYHTASYKPWLCQCSLCYLSGFALDELQYHYQHYTDACWNTAFESTIWHTFRYVLFLFLDYSLIATALALLITWSMSKVVQIPRTRNTSYVLQLPWEPLELCRTGAREVQLLSALHSQEFHFLATDALVWSGSITKVMHFLTKANLKKTTICALPNSQSYIRGCSKLCLQMEPQTVTGHPIQPFENVTQCLIDFHCCLVSKSNLTALRTQTQHHGQYKTWLSFQ